MEGSLMTPLESESEIARLRDDADVLPFSHAVSFHWSRNLLSRFRLGSDRIDRSHHNTM